MKRFPFILVLFVIFLIGCGDPRRNQIVDDSPQKDGAKPVAPKMSEVGDYLPPLDGERVQVAPPKGWHTLPRNPDYLVRFIPKKEASYPAILVTVQPFEDIAEVTSENLKEYRKLLDDPGEDVQLRRIERFVAVSYTKQGTLKDGLRTVLLDRQFLDTVVDHRRYQFELRAKQGTLDKYMPDLLAVAVKTQFMNRQGVEELEDLTADSTEAEGEETKKTGTETTPEVKTPPATPEPTVETPATVPPSEPAAQVEKTIPQVEQKKTEEKKPSRRRRTSEFE